MITGPNSNTPSSSGLDNGLKLSAKQALPVIAPAASKSAEVTSTHGEAVVLSEQARNMLKLEQDIRNQSGVREKKVADIKQQLNNGSYNIDPGRLANKMIQIDEWF